MSECKGLIVVIEHGTNLGEGGHQELSDTLLNLSKPVSLPENLEALSGGL